MMIDIHWNKWSLIDMDDMLTIKHYHAELGKNFFHTIISLNLSSFRRFYARQDEMINQLSTMHERHTSGTSHDERVERHKRWSLILIKTTLISNIVR
jgi:hypothetical protein